VSSADETERRSEPKLVAKLRDQRERHGDRSRIVRVLFIAAGVTLLLGGIAMLVLPGPAFVVIPIGLALLSLEFTWAENALDSSLEQAAKAQRKAAETTPVQRALTAAAIALGVGAFVTWAVVADVPVVPV
jgi:uncharacterized protein (TIGR02611 family)